MNEFGQQEPGDDIEIKQYYENKWGVTFPVAKKTDLEHKLFKRFGKPSWNFNKYLFDVEHKFVKRYESKIAPEEIIKDV